LSCGSLTVLLNRMAISLCLRYKQIQNNVQTHKCGLHNLFPAILPTKVFLENFMNNFMNFLCHPHIGVTMSKKYETLYNIMNYLNKLLRSYTGKDNEESIQYLQGCIRGSTWPPPYIQEYRLLVVILWLPNATTKPKPLPVLSGQNKNWYKDQKLFKVSKS